MLRFLVIAACVCHAALGAVVLEVTNVESFPLSIATEDVPSVSSESGFTFLSIFRQTPGNTGYLFANGMPFEDTRCLNVMLPYQDSNTGLFYGEHDGGTRQMIYQNYPFQVDDGEWHALAAVFEPGLVTLYLDGARYGNSRVLEGTAQTCNGADEKAYVGVRPPRDKDRFLFDGYVSSLRIYDTVLTPYEIVEASVLPDYVPPTIGAQADEQELPTDFPSMVDPIPVVNGTSFSIVATGVSLASGTRGYFLANTVGDNDGRCLTFFIESITNNLSFFYGEDAGGDRVAVYSSTIPFDVDDGAFHDYAITVTVNTISFYADGALLVTKSLPQPVVSCPYGVAMTGARPPSTLLPFTLDASVASLTFYNSELDPSTLASLFGAGISSSEEVLATGTLEGGAVAAANTFGTLGTELSMAASFAGLDSADTGTLFTTTDSQGEQCVTWSVDGTTGVFAVTLGGVTVYSDTAEDAGINPLDGQSHSFGFAVAETFDPDVVVENTMGMSMGMTMGTGGTSSGTTMGMSTSDDESQTGLEVEFFVDGVSYGELAFIPDVMDLMLDCTGGTATVGESLTGEVADLVSYNFAITQTEAALIADASSSSP